MGYSDQELKSDYEDLEENIQTGCSVWNAYTVYFYDEIVEYQGKYYIALTKTSAEVPGRSKAGIWKEIDYNEDEAMNEPDYDDFVYEEAIPSENIKSKKTKPVTQVKEVNQTKNSVRKKEPAITKKVQNKPINKPLTTKKTLKEREVEKSQKVKKPKETVAKTAVSMKTMQLEPNEQSIVNKILKEMEFKKIKGFNSDDHNICTNLLLPQEKEGAKLQWNSSHTELISSKGEVNRPDDGEDVAVNLSLTVSINKTAATRYFTLWVKALERVLSDEECVADVYNKLNFEHIKGTNTKASAVIDDLNLVTQGLHDTQIHWASSQREILDEEGHIRKENLNENTKIRLYAIIVKSGIEKLKTFDVILKV